MNSWLALLTSLGADAQEPGPPRRTIPPSVLVELAAIEDRFELALATDCDVDLCFSKGCTYGAHSIADRAPASSMPGLGHEPGPGAVEAQAWLTQARCEFAYEGSMEAAEVQALARRLQTKVSAGFAVVGVGSQALPELPSRALPEPVPEPEPELPPEPEPFTVASAARELWAVLLGNATWILGVVLGTLAATALIWAWRRVGRETFEEKALLAELGREPVPEPAPAVGPDPALAAQLAAWRVRLHSDRPDPALQGMLRDLLRAGELPLLAKAVLTFPDALPRAFPAGGDIAASKLGLAEYLKSVDATALPSDTELFAALNRHASSSALATQRDAEVVRSLREEFGAAGRMALIEGVSPRTGALLYALAPAEAQHELVHLLAADRLEDLAEELLRSNRMDANEAESLFEVIRSGGQGLAPVAPAGNDVSDRGAEFDAAGALSILLPRVAPRERGALLERALERFGGSLPAWYGEILVPDMVASLPDEERADLLLGADADGLAAWLSLLDPAVAERVLAGAPGSLRGAVRGAAVPASRAKQVALAERGRRDLAKGFEAHLARTRTPFAEVVRRLAEHPA